MTMNKKWCVVREGDTRWYVVSKSDPPPQRTTGIELSSYAHPLSHFRSEFVEEVDYENPLFSY
jgi:hypothetical protein